MSNLPVRSSLAHLGTSTMAQWVKTQKAWVQSLSQEDPLEKETATHSSSLA